MFKSILLISYNNYKTKRLWFNQEVIQCTINKHICIINKCIMGRKHHIYLRLFHLEDFGKPVTLLQFSKWQTLQWHILQWHIQCKIFINERFFGWPSVQKQWFSAQPMTSNVQLTTKEYTCLYVEYQRSW